MLPKVVDGLLKLLLTLALIGCTNQLARVTRGLNNHTKRKLMSFVDSSFRINPLSLDSLLCKIIVNDVWEINTQRGSSHNCDYISLYAFFIILFFSDLFVNRTNQSKTS